MKVMSQSERELPWHNLAHYWQNIDKDKNTELQTVVHEIFVYTPFTINCNVKSKKIHENL